MLTSPVAQLVSHWTGDLKVGGSRPVQDTSKINPIFAGFRWLSSWRMRRWLHAAITRTRLSPSEILPSSFKTWLPRFNAKPKINWMQNYNNLWIIKQATPTLINCSLLAHSWMSVTSPTSSSVSFSVSGFPALITLILLSFETINVHLASRRWVWVILNVKCRPRYQRIRDRLILFELRTSVWRERSLYETKSFENCLKMTSVNRL